MISSCAVDGEGDCVGDGIRTDGKDPTKYTIIKNDDGTLTFTVMATRT